MGKITHFLYCPLLGLGLYGGHRGSRWLRNRIHIFKQFVLPSLLAQTSANYVLWVSVRPEDKNDPLIIGFKKYLEGMNGLSVIFTYAGVCFWDDKYPERVAHDRLATALHDSMPELLNAMGEATEILMTIQPSDDCYYKSMVEDVQNAFAQNPEIQALVFPKGYVMDYTTKKIAEWNPKTSPPFYTIKFPRGVFIDPFKHIEYAGIESHEYLPTRLATGKAELRGFLVGTHGENISTIFDHPFRGEFVPAAVLGEFGLSGVDPLTLPISIRKRVMRMLPHGWQRKLRYWLGERGFAKIYDFLRS